VKVDSFTGQVWRPNMLGALVAKAAAYTVPTDPGRTVTSPTSPSSRP